MILSCRPGLYWACSVVSSKFSVSEAYTKCLMPNKDEAGKSATGCRDRTKARGAARWKS